MRYLLLLSADSTTTELPGCAEWTAAMRDRGVLVTTVGLHPPETANTVRVRGGEVLVGDGPFAETKEQVGGFTLIECADLDEANAVAASHPWAKLGVIEVRRVMG